MALKKIIVTLIVLSLTIGVFAEEKVKNDVIKVNYEKKSAAKAIIMSSLFPGAGQLYTNKKSITGYIFPVLEIALIGGAVYYNSKGNDETDNYEDFANKHYERNIQYEVENLMIDVQNEDVYDEQHFSLDQTNTQHFYEDIAKYNKYIFGWDDWQNKYNYEGQVEWSWSPDAESPDHVWNGNYPTNPEYADEDSPSMDSTNRDKYIKMRKDAEDYYSKKDMMISAVMFNHIIAAVDAYRVTAKYNREAVRTNKIGVDFKPVIYNNELTAFLSIKARF